MKNAYIDPIACFLLLGSIIVVTPTSAVLAGPPPPPPDQASAFFAEKTAKALGRAVDLSATKDGLPEVIVALVEKRYPGANYGNARGQTLQRLRAAATEFDKQWTTYEAKKNAVGAALAKARGAAPEQAEAVLRAVLSPAPRNDEGFIKRKRGFVGACDAEVDAVFALAKVLAAAKKYAALVELTANLKGCRKISDRSQELLIWLAVRTRDFGKLKSGQVPEIGEAVNRIIKAARTLDRRNRQLAKAFYRALPSYGLRRVGLGDYKRVKRNEWVLMREIYQPTLSARSLRYVYNRTFQESYGCKRTNKVIGFNVVTGKWDYQERCKSRSVKVKASVAAALVQPPPAWATGALDRFKSVWVVGRVKKLGPRWKLAKAQMVDLRFLKWREPRR